MSFLKKKNSYRLSISTIFFFAFFVSIIVDSIQTVSAAVPTDPASCATAGGVCENAYTLGFARSCSVGTKQGMCHIATASENSSSNQQCCVAVAALPLCDHPCQPGCPSSNPTDATKSCSQAGLFCCGPLVAGSTPNSQASCLAISGGQCVNQPTSGVTVCPTGKKLSGVCSTTAGGNSNVDCCVTDTSYTPPGAGSCPAGGCTGGQCTTLGGSCSGTSCTNGSFGSCSLGGECCKPAAVPGASASIQFKNPLAFDTVEGVLGSILGTLRGIIVVLALVFIVIGAVLYITSAGDDGRMKTAKGAITASMIGLALGIAAPSFLKQIGDVLGWGAVTSSLPAGTRTLTEIALSVLQFLLSIVGILGIIMLVIGGLAYLTSAGNEERADSGKKIVTYAIIGIAVALAALIIVTQIAALFV